MRLVAGGRAWPTRKNLTKLPAWGSARCGSCTGSQRSM